MKILKPLLAVAAVAALGVTATTTAQAAQSAKPVTSESWAPTAINDGCTITDIGPEKIVIGIAPKRVQFSVQTDCDSTKDVKWAVAGDTVSTSAHVSWFAACTYYYVGPAVIDCSDDGATYVDPITNGPGYTFGNNNAGENNIYAYAFVDKNHNGYDDDYADCDYDDAEDCADSPKDRDYDDATVQLLRRTSWFSSFNAAPEPRRKGQTLTLSGQYQVADWNSASYTYPDDHKVKVQFRAAGSSQYKNVASVWTSYGAANYQAKVSKSGYWRFYFPGTDTTAASYSNSDYVKVNPAH